MKGRRKGKGKRKGTGEPHNYGQDLYLYIMARDFCGYKQCKLNKIIKKVRMILGH